MRRLLLTALCALAALPSAALAADPERARQWGLDMVAADGARSTATGTGAVVAVIDTGVRANHPDLAGRLLPGKDFVQNDDIPQDGDGHGTHVAGIVVAVTGNGIGVESVAPGARVLPIRVLDDNGEGFVSDVIRGIDEAIAQRADVINLSLSADFSFAGGNDPAYTAALERAVKAGIVVVAAAGNSGLPTCENPSAQGRILCVGSVDRRRNRSFFSSFGEGLGLVAPGGSALPFRDEDILSTYTSPDYQEVAGTSQAAPHVAGVAALLVSLGVRGQDAVRRILSTATDVGPSGPDSEFGAGIVNAERAVAGLGQGGGGGGGGNGSPGSAAVITVPRSQTIRVVIRRRGVLIRCRAAGRGRCFASVRYRGKRIARGIRSLPAGKTRSFRARLTRYGRSLLGRRTRVRARASVKAPGARAVTRTVILKR